MGKKAVCLAVMFNHKFDKNLEKLDRIYSGRFPDVRYIVPFYEGSRKDVIPVYENSWEFEGYIAQAARQLEGEKFSHYIFIADDLILNPGLDSSNILSEIGIGENTGYIKEVTALCDRPFGWLPLHRTTRLLDGVKNPNIRRKFLENSSPVLELPFGVEAARELPDREKAITLFNEKSLSMKEISAKNLRGLRGEYIYRNAIESLLYLAKKKIKGKFFLKYPLAASYSDFIIVPSRSFRKFSHYLGVFAAIGVFAEVAIPTSLILTCGKIVSERDLDWKGTEFWGYEAINEFSEKNGYSLKTLYSSFGEKQLYVHPVKLSKWDIEGI